MFVISLIYYLTTLVKDLHCGAHFLVCIFWSICLFSSFWNTAHVLAQCVPMKIKIK
jgi:hypothetical protein